MKKQDRYLFPAVFTYALLYMPTYHHLLNMLSFFH